MRKIVGTPQSFHECSYHCGRTCDRNKDGSDQHMSGFEMPRGRKVAFEQGNDIRREESVKDRRNLSPDGRSTRHESEERRSHDERRKESDDRGIRCRLREIEYIVVRRAQCGAVEYNVDSQILPQGMRKHTWLRRKEFKPSIV